EPSVGLHPLVVQTLLSLFDKLTAKGATAIVIEHDLDFIVNVDHVIDPGLREATPAVRSSPPAPLRTSLETPTCRPESTWLKSSNRPREVIALAPRGLLPTAPH